MEEDQLKMKGSTPLNIAIFLGGCLAFGGTMYGLTRHTKEENIDHQLEAAAQQSKADGSSEAQAGRDGEGDFAKMEGGPAGDNPQPAMSGTVPTSESPAETTPPDPADTSDAAGPTPGGTPPEQRPQAMNESAPASPMGDAPAAAAETTGAAATASSTTPAPQPADSAVPSAASASTAPSPEPVATPASPSSPAPSDSAPMAASTDAASSTSGVASTDDAAKSEPAPAKAAKVAKADGPLPPVKEKPKPSAMDALSAWWEPSKASPFNVQYVGRSEDEKKIVILFSNDVGDAAAAGSKIRVLDDRGQEVAGNWAKGESPHVLVHDDLAPGRYLVVIDPALSGAQGQPVGVPLHGPVVLQPETQAS